MGSFSRFTRYMKDVWKAFVRQEDDDLRSQALSLEKELARLRKRTLSSAKEREEAALNQARLAVQQMREIHDNLIATEKSVAEFVAKLGVTARQIVEAQGEMRVQSSKNFITQQTKEMLRQRNDPIAPTDDTDKGLLLQQPIEQENQIRESEPKTSRATDDKDIIFAANMDGNAAPEINRNCDKQSLATTEKKDGVSHHTKNTNVYYEMQSSEKPQEASEELLEESKSKSCLEEKSHIDGGAKG